MRTHEQGATAGSVAAANGLGIILGPIVGTFTYTVDEGAPYALVGGLLLLVSLTGGRRCGGSDGG